jgi:hypothetical protein
MQSFKIKYCDLWQSLSQGLIFQFVPAYPQNKRGEFKD